MQRIDRRANEGPTPRDTVEAAGRRLWAYVAARPAGPTIQVWDLGVRAFHWLLVTAVIVAALTGFVLGMTTLEAHLIAGIGVAALVGARVVWGFLGPTHARFSRFAYGPRTVLGHLRHIRAGGQHRHLGHNPLGAMMVFALLLVLALIVLTGTLALGGMFKQGPLAAFTSFVAGRQLLGLHQVLAILLLLMVGAHLAGVAFESRRSRENLVRAMVTGQKETQPPAASARPARAWPRLAAAIVLGGGAALTLGVVALARLPVPGLPPAHLDPLYKSECGACHFAYPPSLAPAATWSAIMDNLQNHFGEDASLSPAKTKAIKAYLLANAAGHFDTLPANALRITDPADPLRITSTPFWRHMHRHIPAAVFNAQAVGGKGECNACHHDASTGRFAPQAIGLPESVE